MTQDPPLHKVAFVGDYLPRKCGIATFTHDLRHAVAEASPGTECIVVPVNDLKEGYDYPSEVRFEIEQQDLNSYRRAADFLNFSNVDVVSVQHEYGIYGGPAGSHLLRLLRDLRVPAVTTLHTILEQPSADQKQVLQQLTELSARVVVMSERGQQLLETIYDVPSHKIDLVAHGIPDIPFVDPNFYKDQFGVEGKLVALTFGLLSPNKGIEHMLRALPQIVARFPNFVYIVLGATHPNLVREQGESYRMSLERLAQDLGVKQHVIFYNRFLELHELTEFIGAADIYITPYLNPAQITSGTLAYSFGCGKAVVSTPYWHAEELLADDRGVLVPFADSAALAREVIALLEDEPRRHAMRKRAYLLGREMVWSHVGALYANVFRRARQSPVEEPMKPQVVRTLAEESLQLHAPRLEHLLRLTDSTGILQHATHTIPNFHEGYGLDDNARALILTILLDELGIESAAVQRLATTYAGFIYYAFDEQSGWFRNFIGYDRRWLEPRGSDDSLGRAAWALGCCVGRSRQPSFQSWGLRLFEIAATAVAETTSPRAWAFGLMGIHEYFRRFSGDRLVTQLRDTLITRLITLFDRNADSEWPWLEPEVTYANARIPHALILSGRWGNSPRAFDIGLRSLRWLTEVQRAPAGHFRPIGCHGFFRRGEEPAQFDQQPIEAQAMVSASIEAYRATHDTFWLDQARLSMEWFLGRNDLGLPLYEAGGGGCCDGLHADRVNQNQGAESTLAFLLALAEMQLLENSLATIRKVREPHDSSPATGEFDRKPKGPHRATTPLTASSV